MKTVQGENDIELACIKSNVLETKSRDGRGRKNTRECLSIREQLRAVLLHTLALLLDLLLFHLLHGFLSQLLSEESLHDVLLSGSPVTNHDHHTACNIAGDGAAKDDGSQSKWTLPGGFHTPRDGTQCHLKKRMTVKNDNDSDE